MGNLNQSYSTCFVYGCTSIPTVVIIGKGTSWRGNHFTVAAWTCNDKGHIEQAYQKVLEQIGNRVPKILRDPSLPEWFLRKRNEELRGRRERY